MTDIERVERRCQRERIARKEAEAVIEEKSRELYLANRKLANFNQALEIQVAESTAELRKNNRQLQLRVSELHALHEVSKALTGVFDLQLLLDRIITVSKEVMQADASALLLMETDPERLRFHFAKGEAADEIQNKCVELGQGIAGYVGQTGDAVVVENAYNDPRFDEYFDQLTGIETRSLMAIPVKFKNKIIGVLEVLNRTDGGVFDEGNLRLFESLSASAGVAIENATLFERTNSLAENLRSVLEIERRLTIEKEKMGAYVPKNVRENIARNREHALALGGKTVCVTILFSDIVGFTKLSEHIDPQHLVSFLNIYMTAMTDAVESNGGVVDKFIGDGIMAVFTESDTKKNSLRAVKAGIAMQNALVKLRENWRGELHAFTNLRIRVGVNTGEVVAGNIGSMTRMDYTVIGDNVNVAARIESVCVPGGVYMSESTYEKLDGLIDAEKMLPINVKNRERAVQTYAVKVDQSI